MKITFGEMPGMSVRGVLVYCHCGHHTALEAHRWRDEVRVSDIEPRFVCAGCGGRGADSGLTSIEATRSLRYRHEKGQPRGALN